MRGSLFHIYPKALASLGESDIDGVGELKDENGTVKSLKRRRTRHESAPGTRAEQRGQRTEWQQLAWNSTR